MHHSYSSNGMFETCPRQYQEVKVLKLHPFRSTPETEFGNRAHEALENYAKRKTPLPAEFSAYTWVCELIDSLTGKVYAEYDFSIGRDGRQVGPRDWSAKRWSGMADLLEISGTSAFVVDYKSGGSKYPKVDQLACMAYFTFLVFPEVETVTGVLLFLQDAKVVPDDGSARWTRAADFERLRAEWEGKADLIEQHAKMNAWPATPNNLCGWCVCTTCPHHAPAVARREAKAARFNK